MTEKLERCGLNAGFRCLLPCVKPWPGKLHMRDKEKCQAKTKVERVLNGIKPKPILHNR
jgi:hypothetical protein